MPLEPPPEGVTYPTSDAAYAAIQAHAKTQGYAVRVKRSTSTDHKATSIRYKKKLWLQCARGGKPKSHSTGQRRSQSRKVDCPFSVLLTRVGPPTSTIAQIMEQSANGTAANILATQGQEAHWKVTVKNVHHNHEAEADVNALPMHRHRDFATRQRIYTLSEGGVSAKETLMTLLAEGKQITIRDVYNERGIQRKRVKEGKDPVKEEGGNGRYSMGDTEMLTGVKRKRDPSERVSVLRTDLEKIRDALSIAESVLQKCELGAVSLPSLDVMATDAREGLEDDDTDELEETEHDIGGDGLQIA